MNLRDRYDSATAGLDAPFAIVDLPALRANAADLVRRAAGKPIRVASKSVRCRAILAEVLAMDGFAGIMAFTLPEALWLACEGVSDDILVAYPTADRSALRELAADEHAASVITLMVDSVDHLDLVERHSAGRQIRVCIDVDASYRVLNGMLQIGPRRSPLHSPEQVRDFAETVLKRPGLRLVGLMAYEGQIAGVGDAVPGQAAKSRVIRAMQKRSRLELARRRAAIVRAVRDLTDLEFVNGGGTGSVEATVREKAVTEVAAGSGLYQPHLFDYYSNFSGRPAALFALPVVRRPGPGVVTCLGGGYLASGTADSLRLPRPHLPTGLSYNSLEGAGEVQTPLHGDAADLLSIGDRVWFRHTKAGELCERFAELHLIEDDRITATVPTYRGEGKTFL
ncbi:amino acid deaminase/aldolase [Actinomadura rupiterrae]|uniref:amino acid deaminase/aldolase n=1 Tax=Actinomadura rupiterrae TaxID=559627 RepID=UPI0020A47D8B|nr:amino acid deaminase/aldolase [Actinomadura rupiterrae]MCP2334910.1 D-serine deaminase-like pyridoxal phosphate-dependent protein [Actinomadura rupiterrae]